MIKLENTKVFNFEGAFRGLRNPLNSWDKSDSRFGIALDEDVICYEFDRFLDKQGKDFDNTPEEEINYLVDNCFLSADKKSDCIDYAMLGQKDINLAQRMIAGGTDESKFLRQILVCVDIIGPLAWWKEFDTYKVATVVNSCSTMHTIHKQPITEDLFSFESPVELNFYEAEVVDRYLHMLDNWREEYNLNKDKDAWRKLIMYLPEGFNQKRTWTANYQTLRSMYFARRHHKLQEWRDFCEWIESLPYAKELICYNPKEEKGV